MLPRFRCSLVLGQAILCALPPLSAVVVAPQETMQTNKPADSNPIVTRKKSLTPVQNKINSQLWNAIRQKRGEAGKNGVPTQPVKLRTDSQERVLVDIRATVSQQLNSRIEALGGKVVSTDERLQSTLAYLKLECLEELAASTDVKFIVPAAESATH